MTLISRMRCCPPSPSARRVWVEICLEKTMVQIFLCHPPRGGCGLKYDDKLVVVRRLVSPSARRVWVEIPQYRFNDPSNTVTLREEGVG